MKRNLIFDQDEADPEGLMYDLERANTEGLHEEITVRMLKRKGEFDEIEIDEDLAQALVEQFDLAVNVGPDDRQTIVLSISYKYDYGRVEEPTAA